MIAMSTIIPTGLTADEWNALKIIHEMFDMSNPSDEGIDKWEDPLFFPATDINERWTADDDTLSSLVAAGYLEREFVGCHDFYTMSKEARDLVEKHGNETG